MARDSWHDLVVVERAGLALDRAQGWLVLLGLNGGLWLIVAAGLLHGAQELPVLTLAGLILVDAGAILAVWWQEQRAECEAAHSRLRLAHAAAEVQAVEGRDCVILPEGRGGARES